jgi:hypothetical protein
MPHRFNPAACGRERTAGPPVDGSHPRRLDRRDDEELHSCVRSSSSYRADVPTLDGNPSADDPRGGSPMDPTRLLITRQHVVNLLPVIGLSPEEEARLLGLHHPVEFAEAAAAFESVGVELGTLTDRMGGSP